ncbi:hypothetical protein AY599_06375 [Leptolyngbya valderiana BDU 20041]|nr:hypothetical protein AY599_06375 [Leptolyngbya valderiana BDU 20041]
MDRRKGPSVNLPEVAKWQKILLFIILGMLILYVANIGLAVTGNLNAPPPAGSPAGTPASPTAISLVLSAVGLALVVGAIVAMILIGGALGWGILPRVLCALLMFCPLINLITLLVVNAKATAALRAGGYKVGFMGAQGPAA